LSYKVLWHTKALDSLKELDQPARKRIFDKVNDFDNPHDTLDKGQ